MALTTPLCPQCGGTLPRHALWRTIACPWCGATITRAAKSVQAADFHRAWLRARSVEIPGCPTLTCGGRRYAVRVRLGGGAHAEVLLADRLDAHRERVILKTAASPAGGEALRREAAALASLQELDVPGAAYYTTRLSQVTAFSVLELPDGQQLEVAVLRNPTGFWGSLDAVQHHYPHGVPAAHIVWMWRRVLDMLRFLHSAGWAHRRLNLSHMLVHPSDHGIFLIGWSGAASATAAEQGRDLADSASAMLSLLRGLPGLEPRGHTIPPAMASLLQRASADPAWCTRMGASEIDRQLTTAAAEAFGPPRFIPFFPYPR